MQIRVLNDEEAIMEEVITEDFMEEDFIHITEDPLLLYHHFSRGFTIHITTKLLNDIET